VYNCAPAAQFAARADVDPGRAPLVFLGRLDRCKGAHTAIAVARRLQRSLIIAGTISPQIHEREYVVREILPRVDGSLVQFVGAVDNAQKSALLGRAAALLLPVEWDEPFPVVLPEALLCGTPVIGFRRGGIPEGIDDGRTGFVCDDEDGMVRAVSRLGEIDRAACRADAERRFSDAAIVAEYERLYESFLA
jgi:glycosyltransferase involved in cell wall biosynthesis